MQERLQKIIARAGIASRRHAEELIKSGMVTVNGQTVTELGSKADESTDHIKVSGKLLRPEHDRLYLVLNKPPEIVSTMSDPEGRRSLQDLLHGVAVRVFPVGRLEYHSMGLVFLTNDGDLANSMLKAHRLRQTYLMKLKSLLTFEEIEQLTRATGARITRVKGKESPWYEVTLTEARRDALRNRLFQTGHPVEKVKRIRLGNLELGSLQPGEHRPLSSEEIAALSRAIEGKLEPALEPPKKRAYAKRPKASTESRHDKRVDAGRRGAERRSGSGTERRRGFKTTKGPRTRPRKTR
jgi:23S rRNA pseudouridine2605 synthase